MFDPLGAEISAAHLRAVFPHAPDYLEATRGLAAAGWAFDAGSWRRAQPPTLRLRLRPAAAPEAAAG